ncbi:MAG: PAS domain S-box protein [Nitrospirae bacterium]|nr:PAS domain S-box protein [Nitrospirota bacterium]
MKIRDTLKFSAGSNITIFGFILIILVWIFEAAVHSFILKEGAFLEQLLFPDMHEMWMRLLISSLLAGFIVYVQMAFNRQLKIKKDMLAEIKKTNDERAKTESVIASVGDGLCLMDSNCRITYQNKIHEDIFGKQIGNYCYKLYKGEPTCKECPVYNTFNDGDINTTVKTATIDAEQMYFEITSSPMKNAAGEITAAIEIVRNVTERKWAEEAIVASEMRFRATFAEAAIGMALVNMDGCPLVSNSALQNMLGYSWKELCNMVLKGLTHPDDADADRRLYEELMAGKRNSYQIEKRYIRKDGQLLWGHLTISLVRGPEGNPQFAVAMIEDISDRKKMEGLLIEIEEKERQRIGQDLHDGLGQLLTGIAFKLRGLGRKLERNSSAGVVDAAEISVLVDDAKVLVGQIAKGLSPVETEHDGFISALEQLAVNTYRMFGIDCVFLCDSPVSVQNKTAVTQLYRIAQEAVTNAAKHGKPEHISISLSEENGKVSMTIKNDGAGIPDMSGKQDGMGLKIMKYRANLINASLEIKRDVTGGTIVKCLLSE